MRGIGLVQRGCSRLLLVSLRQFEVVQPYSHGSRKRRMSCRHWATSAGSFSGQTVMHPPISLGAGLTPVLSNCAPLYAMSLFMPVIPSPMWWCSWHSASISLDGGICLDLNEGLCCRPAPWHYAIQRHICLRRSHHDGYRIPLVIF